MNFRKNIKFEKTELMLVPMIDIIFFLLSFFILTWNFARWETQMDITVPTAKESTQSRRQPGEIILNVTRSGEVYLNEKKFKLEELQGLLKRISAQFPGQSIIIRADRQVEYRYVIRVLDICRLADIWNVGFATRREEDEKR